MATFYETPDQFSALLLDALLAGTTTTDVRLSGVGGLPTDGNTILTIFDGTGRDLEKLTGWTSITGTTLHGATRLLGGSCPANSRVEVVWDARMIANYRVAAETILDENNNEARRYAAQFQH